MIRALLTLLVTAAFVVAPAFTSFTGFSSDQLPIPQIDPPVQLAGYAFGIWGVIYAWLLLSAVYGLWKRADDPAWDAARPDLIVSLAIGAPWLYVATQSAIWATVMIIAMTLFAIRALLATPRLFDRWMFQAPVALYAGWLTAASWVSIASTSAGYGIATDSWGWAVIGIIGALAVAIWVGRMRPNAPEYLAAVIWALIGIIVANQHDAVIIASLAGVGILILLAQIAYQQTASDPVRLAS